MTTATQLGRADLAELMTLMTGDEKHGPSATSTLDVLWVLYDRVLRVDPRRPDDPDRDRFLLSKGHGPMAYYAVLAAKGFLTADDLRSFGGPDSILGYHPDRTLVPGVEISSGSLGHGLGLAVGTALGLRISGRTARVVVLVGDAELEEGSQHGGDPVRRTGRARQPDRRRDRQLVRVAGLARRHRAAVHRRGLVGRRRRRPRPRRAGTRVPTAVGARPHAVVAHVEPKEA